jgi:hypothetical protein
MRSLVWEILSVAGVCFSEIVTLDSMFCLFLRHTVSYDLLDPLHAVDTSDGICWGPVDILSCLVLHFPSPSSST